MIKILEMKYEMILNQILYILRIIRKLDYY